MSESGMPAGAAQCVDDVLITPQLARRPARARDLAAESRALGALADEMAANPDGVLRKCADLALELCRADSAGISILEGDVFRWHAAAGAFAAQLGGTIPREASPCGTVIARDRVLLFRDADRFFPTLRDVEPRIHENLLVPWHVNGRPAGTLWAVKHSPEGQFDAEDARLLESLARFAAAAHQTTAALAEAKPEREALERRIGERFRRAMGIRTVGVLFFTLDGRVTDANAAFERMSGHSRDELLAGAHWEALTPPEFRAATARAAEELALRGETAPYEKQMIHKDGSRWWGLFAPTRLSGSGPASECVEFIIDITERKRAEEARRASEERLRLIVESARDYAIFITDAEDRIVDWMPGAAAVFGWSAEEAVGQPGVVLFTPEDREAGAAEREIETARREGTALNVRWHLRKDGTRVFIEGHVRALRNPDGGIRGFLKIGQDVTARRTAEEALRESERRFRTLAEGIPQLVFRSRSSGERSWGSPQWVAYTGLSEAESLGLSWLRAIHPDDRAATMAAWGEAEARGIFSVEHRIRSAADDAWRWFQSRALPVRDDPGAAHAGRHAVEWLGTSTDIEEQMRAREVLSRGRAELETLVAARTAELAQALHALRTEMAERSRAEEALRHAQKIEAVGQLTGGIAHDFNNMLQGITGGLEIAQRRVAQGRAEDAVRYMDAVRETVNRAAGLTRRLLAFARRQRLDPRPLDADGLVAGLAELIRRTVGPGVAVELKLRHGGGQVLCDANELENALLNLCINARDAMPEGGRLTIGTEEVTLSATDIAAQATAEQRETAPGAYVEVSVADTGMGMPPEVLERVFEPFFTTKPLGHGTGLGLSQVYGFVRQSGGLVRLESTPGRGTTVRLFLPRHERVETAEQRGASAPGEAAGTGETVLLVDDEAAARGPVAERLRELGYRVLEAADGPAALRLLGKGERVDLLVTDVGLPRGMNGRQVADAVRERLPGIPVLFITGYARARLPPGTEVIGKPFELEALMRRVQALLGAGRRAEPS